MLRIFFVSIVLLLTALACDPTGIIYTNDDYTNNVNNSNNPNNNNNNNNVTEICYDGIDNDGDGFPDCQDLDCLGDPYCQNTNNTNDGGTDSDGSQYDFDADAGGECAPENQIPCDTPVPSGCQATEIENNGLDDNCNGQIDEIGSTTCLPGAVRACFMGPPGRRNTGACVDGQQICIRSGGGEFGTWGPCEGGISPGPETCDSLDNDCNGCVDDGLCCTPPIECPSSDHITLQGAQPFNDFIINGANYYSGQAFKWEWTVSTGPCDDVLGVRSYSINGHSETNYVADTEQIVLNFSLSGEYTITMRVYYSPTEYYECIFVLRVAGPGLRVEACWDNHDTTDVDLHLMREGLGTNFCSDQDCFYSNCKASNWDHANWGTAASPIDACLNTEAGPEWQSNYGECRNPRLDLDNIFDNHGITPENINVDTPNNGDVYRVGVDYYYGTAITHPVVNIYCDGVRVATFGYPVANQVELSDCGGMGCASGHFWRVADVLTSVDSGTGEVTCQVTSLVDGNGDPNITYGNSSY